MIKLYGISRSIAQEKIGGDFKVYENRELVATFSSEETLDEYLKPRLLKNPIEQFGFEEGRKFRKDCDMYNFSDYETEECADRTDIPHDPI